MRNQPISPIAPEPRERAVRKAVLPRRSDSRDGSSILASGAHDKYPQKFVVVGQVEVDGRSSVIARPWVLPYHAAPAPEPAWSRCSSPRPSCAFALRA